MKKGVLLICMIVSVSSKLIGEIGLDDISSSSTVKSTEISNVDMELESVTSFLGANLESILSSEGIEVTVDGEGGGDSDEEPQLVGDALVYPNPSSFSVDNPKIGYRLNQNMTIEIRLYTVQGYQVGRKIYESGEEEGALAGYNKVDVLELLNGQYLPAGTYIYILIFENKVIAKEFMAVKP